MKTNFLKSSKSGSASELLCKKFLILLSDDIEKRYYNAFKKFVETIFRIDKILKYYALLF